MLNLLVEYSRTHGLTVEPGFKPKTVRWAIVCDNQGRFLNLQELGNPDDKNNRGQPFNVCPDLSQPEMKAYGAGCRHFLVDNVEVVALLGKDGDLSHDMKSKAKHDFFVSLLRMSAGIMQELGMIASLLDSSDSLSVLQEALVMQRAKATDNVTFGIAGRKPTFLVEDGAWYDWWRDFRQSLSIKKADKKSKPNKQKPRIAHANEFMRCFASGVSIEPVLTQPKIEGLSDVGGLSMGDSLASFKQDSFCSYYLTQAKNAAVSEDMASAYRAGLNDLIAHHSRRLTSAKIAYWYAGQSEVPNDLDPLNWLIEFADPDMLERDAQACARSLLDNIRIGGYADLLNYRFYSITLSGASGRVMIRDWIEGQFAELVGNIDAWFNDLSIVHREGGGLANRAKFLAVLGCLARELKDIPPLVEAKMWRVAVRNEPIPEFTMAQALSRTKIDIIQDNPFHHARMGLLKAYHMRKGDKDMQPYLNEDHPHPAYHCGRLMAVYADLQRAALGDIGAGLVQRYYAAASATPALIFGRLSRSSQFHLNKLEGGLAYWFEQRLTDIWCRLKDTLPRTLTLEEQSLFALGYYQQIAARKKFDKKQTTDNHETKGE